MLTILLGDYGSGKTTTAKWLVKEYGGVHLRSEMLTRGKVPLVDKLNKIMKPHTNYYLDGWNGNYHFEDLPRLLNTEVRYIACMAPPERIHEAHKQRGQAPRTAEEIRATTQHAVSIALTYDESPLFADTTERPVTFWNKRQWLSCWMEINLYGQLKDKGEYQDVELNNYAIKGLSRSFLTWERLAEIIDFKGKSVVDYGCNLGYFSFKAEQVGAVSVTGVDISHSVLATTRCIAMVKNSKVHLVVADLKRYWPPETDIIMALNTLHHIGYDRKVMLRIFGLANTVVIEMPRKDIPLVTDVAARYSFGLEIANSHREGRCIAIYSRYAPVIIPKHYEYHPKREAFKWWLIRFASRRLPFKGLKRKVWRRISR